MADLIAWFLTTPLVAGPIIAKVLPLSSARKAG